MSRRKKIFVRSIIAVVCIFTILAIIETKNLSSKTVHQAFDKFSHDEFTEQQQKNIHDKVFYKKGNTAFVPFIIDNDVSLVQFEKGLFGWKQTYYDRNKNEGSSYSGTEKDGKYTLMHGEIPTEIAEKTNEVKINHKNAKILTLNQRTRIWINMNAGIHNNDDSDDSDAHIVFLDKEGHVIAKE